MESSDLFFEAMLLMLLFSSIPLGVGMSVGLILSIFQAATQIQEQTLTFVPKLAAIALVFFFFGPWMADQLVEYTTKTLEQIALRTLE